MKSNDKNFIQRLQRQEEDALEFIVDKYLPLIKGISYKVLSPLRNDGVVEECINDIFLSIWDHANKFKGDVTDFKKWICAISKFKAVDYYRKAANKVEFSSEFIDLNAQESVEDELLRMEDRAELIQIINQLEPIDQNIFMMKYFLGFRNKDIAKKLNLTETAINNRVHRGKKKLHQKATNLNLGGSVI